MRTWDYAQTCVERREALRKLYARLLLVGRHLPLDCSYAYYTRTRHLPKSPERNLEVL
jgi:hypothetical protein